jgi:SAM-dependent methyltransferase
VNFGSYARYYDQLNRDKDYPAEARYVARRLRAERPGAKRLLELGAGTGIHAFALAAEGFEVTAVERSVEMLEQARRRWRAQDGALRARVQLLQGDIRELRLETRFDAVVALFHVVSYLATDEDLRACFGAVAAHLEPGAPFLFDVWYGPAVLEQRPSIRVRRVKDSVHALTRIAVPELLAAEKLVDVHYQLFARHLATGCIEEVRETHRMRYLFAPELTTLLGEAGLTLRHQEAWLSGEPPSEDTWSVTMIACCTGLGDSR